MGLHASERLERIPVSALKQSLARTRIVRPAIEDRIRLSLARHGQLTPITVWAQQEGYELVDGFKRLRAAGQIAHMTELTAQFVEGKACQAKASILVLNRPGAGVSTLEEAWVVQSLIREDRLTQGEVATLLVRNQSWVSRRLGLVERLIETAQEEIRLGLLGPTMARTLGFMPRGIQPAVLEMTHREGLTSRQMETLVELMRRAGQERRDFLLAHPREALDQHQQGNLTPTTDPRLGAVAASLHRDMRILTAVARRLAANLTRTDLTQMGPSEATIVRQELEVLHREVMDLSRVVQWSRTPGQPLAVPTPTPSTPPPSSPAAPTSRTS